MCSLPMLPKHGKALETLGLPNYGRRAAGPSYQDARQNLEHLTGTTLNYQTGLPQRVRPAASVTDNLYRGTNKGKVTGISDSAAFRHAPG
jgi:hypothetical protein